MRNLENTCGFYQRTYQRQCLRKENDEQRDDKIATLFNTVANIYNEILRYGYLMRGAIVEGDFFHNHIIVYGKGYVQAVKLEEKEAALIFSDARFGDPAYAGTEVSLLHTHLPYALAGSFKDCLSLFNHYVRKSKDRQKARFWIEKAESATSATDPSQHDQLATCKAILEKKLNPPSPQEKEPLPATDPSCPSTNNAECKSRTKRLIFVLLGLPLGFIGLHFLYARRRNLFLITLLAGTFAVCEYLHLTSWLSPRETALCAMTNLILWLGGAIFVKCDGYKRVMPWW